MKLFFNDVVEMFSYKSGFVKPTQKFLRFLYEIEEPDILLIFYPHYRISFSVNWKTVEIKGTPIKDGYFYAIVVHPDKIEILDGKLCLMLLRTGYGHLKVIKKVKLKN